ncbi:cache domain-containing protein [Desulfovibrio inopinatus]|uniref:cache domain-containing protein n=1 Tax=Desulfovibrio inopinatus TaxID=102109 RepID=UPI0004132E63|nr:cache domain-containing protein [Desulfovibrio inopinatus]
MSMLEVERENLLKMMPAVSVYKEKLKTFDRQWVKITLTGKINSNRVASTLIDFMETTQNKFLSLQENLIHELVNKNCEKITQEMTNLSQVAIDILKRNLFERTADVGFLATDDDIVQFLIEGNSSTEHTNDIENRLREYQEKYTVYEEIIIFDNSGNVCAHLDKSSDIRTSHDPVLSQAALHDGYIETFNASDMRPSQERALIYSHRIVHPEYGTPLGTLCLCFDFAGEMDGIYKQLIQKERIIICILNDQGHVISSSDPQTVPLDSHQSMVLGKEFQLVRIDNTLYLAKTAETNGYQGFFGLPWFGHILYPLELAFGKRNGLDVATSCDVRNTNLFAGSLRQIDEDADDILSDLGLVVLNGEVMAAKQIVNADPVICQEANALPPVLDAIHQVGEHIRDLFSESISSLLNTVLSSRLDDMKFQASLAIDIMDRNLYERANDCRWWALNSTFRRILSQSSITEADKKRLEDILEYINSLYTVYTNLILFDATGHVVAASSKNSAVFFGDKLSSDYIRRCLGLSASHEYCVSKFKTFEEARIGNQPSPFTYIYNAAVFHEHIPGHAVGGIALVFDSGPQFKAMLNDALPRNEDGRIQDGSLAFFLDRHKRIISSTSEAWNPGDKFPIEEQYVCIDNGNLCSDMVTIDGKNYILGCTMSNGYREYKRDGIYTNDVLAAVLVEV